MVKRDQTHLRALLSEKGLNCAEDAASESDLFIETIAKANGIPLDESLEWLAGQFGLVPFDLARPLCSTRAEQVFRKLARHSDDPSPWMPFGSVGPVLLCAHYDPSAEESWGIPDFLFVKVLVVRSHYEKLSAD